MSVEEIVGKIVLPVLKENQCEEYPYSKSGSGMRIIHKGTHFFVTAEHVVADKVQENTSISRPPEEILVPANNASREFIPLTEKINVDSQNDSFDNDIAFFKIQETSSSNASVKSERIDCNVKPGDELLVFGYPCQKNVVDCDEKKITRFIKAYTAHFTARTNLCHSRISVDLEDGETLDGVSGGAVFIKSNMKLCGMMLSEDPNRTGLAEIYNADVIYKIMDNIIAGGKV